MRRGRNKDIKARGRMKKEEVKVKEADLERNNLINRRLDTFSEVKNDE